MPRALWLTCSHPLRRHATSRGAMTSRALQRRSPRYPTPNLPGTVHVKPNHMSIMIRILSIILTVTSRWPMPIGTSEIRGIDANAGLYQHGLLAGLR
jgi:hypothetical protein